MEIIGQLNEIYIWLKAQKHKNTKMEISQNPKISTIKKSNLLGLYINDV